MTVVMNLLANQLRGIASLNNVRQASAGAVNGTTIDTITFLEGNSVAGGLLVSISAIAESGTGVVGTFTVEHSDDNTTFVAVPAASILNVVTGAAFTPPTVTTAAPTLARTSFLVSGAIGGNGTGAALRRYVRVVLTVAGTSPVVRASADIQGRARIDNSQTIFAL